LSGEDNVCKLAEEHAHWFAMVVKAIYRDAFIHGFKHGEEAKEKSP
jgi:hypothetical protein